MLCLAVCLLSSGLRRVSEKGHLAVTMNKSGSSNCGRFRCFPRCSTGCSTLLSKVVPGVIIGALLWVYFGCPLDCQTRYYPKEKKTLTLKYPSGAEGLMASSHRTDHSQDLTSNSYQKWWFVMRIRSIDLQL